MRGNTLSRLHAGTHGETPMTTLTVNRLALLGALKIARHFSAGNHQLPMLQSVELKLVDGSLALHATDLETHFVTSIKPDALEQAEPVLVVIKTKALLEAVKRAGGTSISLTFNPEAKTLTLADGAQQESVIPFIDGDGEYPILPHVSGELAAMMPIGEFQEVIRRVAISTAAEATRFAIDGALLKFKDGELKATSTDGHRLSIATAPAVMTREIEGIISNLALKILGMESEASDVQVFVQDGHMKFALGSSWIIVKLMEKTFPNYEGCVPRDNNFVATMSTDALLKVVTQAAALCPKKLQARSQWHFVPGTSAVTLQAGSSNPEGKGSMTAKVAVDYNGGDIAIGLNPAYMKDVLGIIKESSLEIHLRDSERQISINPVGMAGRFSYILMPTRL